MIMTSEEFEQALWALALRKAEAEAVAAEIMVEKAKAELENTKAVGDFQRKYSRAQGFIGGS